MTQVARPLQRCAKGTLRRIQPVQCSVVAQSAQAREHGVFRKGGLASLLDAVGHGAVSVLRTASGMPDDRNSPVLRAADAEHLGRRLAPAVLGGGWCSLVPQRSGSKSVILPLLGGDTSVASQKRPCATASFAKTWRPSSSKRRTAIPAASFLHSFASSLSATCAAGCSATALPVFAVRRATMSCSSLSTARIGGVVRRVPAVGWPTLQHTFGTVYFPPLRFGSGS